MKKSILALVVLLIFTTSITVLAEAEEITLKIDKTEVKTNIITKDNNVYIPLKETFDKIGHYTFWDKENKYITITIDAGLREGFFIFYSPDTKTCYTPLGKFKDEDNLVIVQNGTSYMKPEFIKKTFGYSVKIKQ
ncbi:stalk domain-containing protein [Dethiothermospora halolimnae]|uniref:stalk domain-containing protein n=1 Tax=Dethiothermospora halolimnae TaxID=3114390 RepID=UPI003CCBD1E4